MTQKEFVKKFKTICKENYVDSICVDWHANLQMSYINPFITNADAEVRYVSEMGFDDCGCFYIDFYGVDFRAFEEDLEVNTESQWDLLADFINMYFEFDSPELKVGDTVFWNDPAIHEYPREEIYDALTRRFVVNKIENEIISISDSYSEVEAYANELVHIF